MTNNDWEKKQIMIKKYDNSSKVYNSLYGDEQNKKIKLVLQMIKTKNSDVILDVGCGTGLLMEQLDVISNFKLLVGIDTSRMLLKIAANKLKNLKIRSSIFLVRTDVDYLPFPSGLFTKIFSFTVLQNSPNMVVTVKEISRVAKSNCLLILTAHKKCILKEEFSRILAKADLRFYFKKEFNQIPDHIAICQLAS